MKDRRLGIIMNGRKVNCAAVAPLRVARPATPFATQ